MRKFIVTGVIVAAMLIGTATAIFAQSNDGNKSGDKPTAWLGIVVSDQDGKVTVEDVRSGSPADTANVQIGDVIQKFNGTAVATASDLTKLVQAATPGDKATLAVLRNDKPLNIEVTLGTAPAFGRGRGFPGFPGFPGMGQPGQQPTPIMVAQLLLHARLEEADGGFKVTQVAEQFNPLELKVDDVVTTINGHKVADLDFKTLIEEFANAHKNAHNNSQDKGQGNNDNSANKDNSGTDNGATNGSTTDKPTLTVEVIRDGKTLTLTGDLFGGRFGHGFGFGFGRGHHRGWGGFNWGFGQGDNNPDNSGTPAPTEEAPAATQPA